MDPTMTRSVPTFLLLLLISLLGGCSAEQPLVETRTLIGPDKNFWEPFGITERGGEIFISDGENGRILKHSVDGRFEIFLEGFHTPSHIAFDADGNLFVVDTGAHAVFRVSTRKEVTLVAGQRGVAGFGESLLNGPVGLAIDGDRILVSDTYNDRIVEIVDGGLRTVAGSVRGYADGSGEQAGFDTPSGILLLPDRSLLVADSGNGLVRHIDSSGKVSTVGSSNSREIVDGTLEIASFEEPVALARTQSGDILILDGDSVRVIRNAPIPFVITLSSTKGGFQDGLVAESRFSRPSAVAVSSSGDFLVTDSDNGLVRVISGTLGRNLPADEFHASIPTAEEFRNSGPARWPFEPADEPRDIAGTLGELRGEVSDMSSWSSFHNGLDVAGAYGERTFLVRDEKALELISSRFFGSSRELVRLPRVGYIHLRIGRDQNELPFEDERFVFDQDENGRPVGLRIRRGSRFSAGDLIGTLNSQNHVHLVAGRYGYEYNAIIALQLPGLVDTVVPTIDGVALIDVESGEPLEEPYNLGSNSRLQAVVEAWDRKDANPGRRRLGIFEAGYQISKADGAPAAEEKTTISFRGMPDPSSVGLVYAKGSRAGATGITVFRYIIGNRVSVDGFDQGSIELSNLVTGEYRLRIFVKDFFGNSAERSIPFRIIR